MKNLVLSLFSGIGGLDRGFASEGYCIVSGPEKLLGGDVMGWRAPRGAFEGVIGGPPCQSYSRLNRNRSRAPDKTLLEYCAIVDAARPKWFLMENVVGVPAINISGYTQQRFTLDLAWFTDCSRRRVFDFGSLSGALLNPMYGETGEVAHTALHGGSDVTYEAALDIMGLPADMRLPAFNAEGKKQAVINAVPVQMSTYLAGLVRETMDGAAKPDMQRTLAKRCGCKCGREVYGRKTYFNDTCRMRAHRAKKAA